MSGEQQVSDFHCVTGWTVDKVHWEGIRPATIIDLVAPMPSARYVTFFSLETPYVDQISLDQFLVEDVPDRPTHERTSAGAHPRSADAGWSSCRCYGYKGVKWLSGLRFDAEPGLGYWEQRGYDVNAWVGGGPTALGPEPRTTRRIARFSGAERALHWLLALTFFVMLATGLALFVPDLATVVARPMAKAWHIDAAVALAAGVLALFAALDAPSRPPCAIWTASIATTRAGSSAGLASGGPRRRRPRVASTPARRSTPRWSAG